MPNILFLMFFPNNRTFKITNERKVIPKHKFQTSFVNRFAPQIVAPWPPRVVRIAALPDLLPTREPPLVSGGPSLLSQDDPTLTSVSSNSAPAVHSQIGGESASSVEQTNYALIAVSEALHHEYRMYILVPFTTFCPLHAKRASVYRNYHILCMRNTLHHVGWGVCSHVCSGLCSGEDVTKRYKPNISSTDFHRHLDQHQKNWSVGESMPIVIPADLKRALIDACTRAEYIEILSLKDA